MNVLISETAAPHQRLLCAALLLVSLFAGGAARAAAPEPLRDGVIVFGGEAAYPPFEWLDQGTARGSNIDIQDALAQAGGVQAEHRLADWPDVLRELESGRVDVVAMFKSPQRAERYQFSRTFEFVNHAIYGRTSSANIDSVAELRGFAVAVESRSYAHDHLLADDSGIRTVPAPNTVAALEMVRDGRADYAILSEPAADYLVQSQRLELRRIGSPLWPTEYAFAVR
ncbi:MAG TPA: transporter substrate-binding domain-containing protein, partial [Woeseiaceae bacterium]|nr:transporter substrate-binding domain-containing protein [Woeseiaceae bacterium]